MDFTNVALVRVEECICNNKLCTTYTKQISVTTKLSQVVQSCLDYWKCPLTLNDIEFRPYISQGVYGWKANLKDSIKQYLNKYNKRDKSQDDDFTPSDPLHLAIKLWGYDSNCPSCHCDLSLGYGRNESYIEKTKYDDTTNKNVKWIDYDRFNDYGSRVLYSLGDQWMCGNCWKQNEYIAVKQWLKSKYSQINKMINDDNKENKDNDNTHDEKYNLLFLKSFVSETCNRPEYEKQFIDAGCDDISLLEFIDDEQLKNDIQIKITFHRKMILKRIEEFKIESVEFKKWFNSESHSKYNLSSILKNVFIKRGILTWNSLQFVVKGSRQKLKQLLDTENDDLVGVIWERLKVISQYQNTRDDSNNEGQSTVYI